MLRQTLEYELTLLRAQHGKQTAFSHQLQQQTEHNNGLALRSPEERLSFLSLSL